MRATTITFELLLSVGILMSLTPPVMAFLNEAAQRENVESITFSDDLFQLGILDSFALVDFITVLENEYKIKIPDHEVLPKNFTNLETIEKYVRSKQQ